MSRKNEKTPKPKALTGSASYIEPPVLRVTMSDQDQIEKRANSYTASPVAQANDKRQGSEPEK